MRGETGEIGGHVRLGFEGFSYVEEPTLQEAADALVAHMVRIAAAVYTGGVGPASTELAPDLTALDFIWKLGEHVAADAGVDVVADNCETRDPH